MSDSSEPSGQSSFPSHLKEPLSTIQYSPLGHLTLPSSQLYSKTTQECYNRTLYLWKRCSSNDCSGNCRLVRLRYMVISYHTSTNQNTNVFINLIYLEQTRDFAYALHQMSIHEQSNFLIFYFYLFDKICPILYICSNIIKGK